MLGLELFLKALELSLQQFLFVFKLLDGEAGFFDGLLLGEAGFMARADATSRVTELGPVPEAVRAEHVLATLAFGHRGTFAGLHRYFIVTARALDFLVVLLFSRLLLFRFVWLESRHT